MHEIASSIFIWHGVDRTRPARPLRFLEPGFFDGWSTPVTSAGRPLAPTNVFFPTENIIDIQHFYAVHFWELEAIEQEPAEAPDGSFRAVMRMVFQAGAQSPYAIVRRLGKAYTSPFHFDISILGPGHALAISRLGPEQGNLELMSIILITHNLGIIRSVVDRVAVMFRGEIVETGPVDEILRNPQHPYTKALLACVPRMGPKQPRLKAIDYTALDA